MSKLIPLSLKLVMFIIGSYLLSFVWWNVWMYKGFLGPIPFLHWFVVSDGEFSYVLTQYEMLVHLIIGFAFIVALFLKYKKLNIGGKQLPNK